MSAGRLQDTSRTPPGPSRTLTIRIPLQSCEMRLLRPGVSAGFRQATCRMPPECSSPPPGSLRTPPGSFRTPPGHLQDTSSTPPGHLQDTSRILQDASRIHPVSSRMPNFRIILRPYELGCCVPGFLQDLPGRLHDAPRMVQHTKWIPEDTSNTLQDTSRTPPGPPRTPPGHLQDPPGHLQDPAGFRRTPPGPGVILAVECEEPAAQCTPNYST